MAIAVTARHQSFSATTFGTGDFTTAAFTPTSSSLLVVYVQVLKASTGGPAGIAVSGGGWTYTERHVANYTPMFQQTCRVFTAPVTTGASMTLTVGDTSSDNVYQYGVTVVDITGYDTGTPTGGKVGSTADIGDGAETQTLDAAPATADITLMFLGVDDSGSAANPTYGTGSWTEVYDGVSNIGGHLAYRTSSTSTSVPITDVYTGAGGYDKELMLSLVIKATAGATASPAVVDGLGEVPAPAATGATSITPTTIDGSGEVPTPAATGAVSVTPATVDGLGEVPTPSATATAATASPGVVDGSGEVPTPSATASAATATPAVVDGLGEVPTPTVVGGATATPGVVDGLGEVDTPTVTSSASTTPTTVDGLGEVPTPSATATGDATANPAVIDGLGEVPAPAATSATSTTPATIDALGEVDTPTVTGGSSTTPTTVDGLGEVDTPAATSSTSVTPAVIDGLGEVPTPSATATAALVATLLTSNYDNVDAATFDTASISPAANSLLLVFEFLAAATTAGTASVDEVAGGLTDLTFTQIIHDLDGIRSMGVFRAQCGATPGTGALRISQTGGDATHTGCGWFVVQITGHNTTTPIVQSKLAGGDGTSSAAPTGTLDSAIAAAANRVMAGWQHRANEATAPRTNWTELGDHNGSAPNSGWELQWRNDGTNETTFGCTYATDSRYIGEAVEIAAATGDASATPATVDGLGEVPTPSATSATSVTPTTVDGLGEVLAASIAASFSVTPVTIDAIGEVPVPDILGGVGIGVSHTWGRIRRAATASGRLR